MTNKGITAGVLVALILTAAIHVPANMAGIPDMIGTPLWFGVSFLSGIPMGCLSILAAQYVSDRTRK